LLCSLKLVQSAFQILQMTLFAFPKGPLSVGVDAWLATQCYLALRLKDLCHWEKKGTRQAAKACR
jgi:hypothetical protein